MVFFNTLIRSTTSEGPDGCFLAWGRYPSPDDYFVFSQIPFFKKEKDMFADIAHLKQMLLFNDTDITDGMVKAGSF